MKTNDPGVALLALATLAAVLGGGPVRANEPDVLASRRVSLRGLDLATSRDVATVYRRLRRAAREVCAHSAAPNAYSATCVDRALGRSVDDVDRPVLTALHEARSAR